MDWVGKKVKMTYSKNAGEQRFLYGLVISFDDIFYVLKGLGDGTTFQIANRQVLEIKEIQGAKNHEFP